MMESFDFVSGSEFRINIDRVLAIGINMGRVVWRLM
jgi:hypothetical protein